MVCNVCVQMFYSKYMYVHTQLCHGSLIMSRGDDDDDGRR